MRTTFKSTPAPFKCSSAIETFGQSDTYSTATFLTMTPLTEFFERTQFYRSQRTYGPDTGSRSEF